MAPVFCSLSRSLALAGMLLGLGSAAGAYPANPRGLGGPASGVGVMPGAGAGAAGVGLTREPGVDPVEERQVNPGDLGGRASGVGVMPGAGAGAAGPGLRRW